ncbi:MAG: hypothetical protein ACR2GL_06125 [Thermoleophilaceae bacterium]
MSAELVDRAATVLGPVLDEVVFLGGATVHLWVTESAAPPVRATEDVDVICEAATLAAYHRLGRRLRQCGLTEAIDEPVICRWRSRDPELLFDVMPTDPRILGFSNRWYPAAIADAKEVTLASGARIRAARPTLLVATKLAAWNGRGRGDLLRSLDIHDVLTLIDARPELRDEFTRADPDVRGYVRTELTSLVGHRHFEYAIDSATGGYGAVARERSKVLHERVERLLVALTP